MLGASEKGLFTEVPVRCFLRRWGLLEASHDVGIRVLAASQGESFVGPLYLKSELPVERDGNPVVYEHAEGHAGEPQPVIREVQGSLKEFRADALTLPVVANGHPKVPGVPPPGSG